MPSAVSRRWRSGGSLGEPVGTTRNSLFCRAQRTAVRAIFLRSIEQRAQHESGWFVGGDLGCLVGRLRKPLRRSSYLTFAVALAYTSPIAALCDLDETAIFHFHGRSNTGKTLAGRIAVSVTGPAAKKDLLTFSHTNTGIEDAAARGSGTTVVVDEIAEFQGSSADRAKHLLNLGHRLTGDSDGSEVSLHSLGKVWSRRPGRSLA